MGYQLERAEADALFAVWAKRYDIFAPVLMEGEGCFSDTDIIRYGKILALNEIVWDKKSDYSFKEVLLRPACGETFRRDLSEEWIRGLLLCEDQGAGEIHIDGL